MSRWLPAVLLLAAAACAGGEPTRPTPPPTPQRAVVALKSNDVLVFSGQRVALRDLVWRVTDPQGRVLTDYQLAAQLPAGWTIRNDTVIAPAGETTARLKVTATYMPATATAQRSAGPLFDEVPSDTTDTATVTAALDLKSRRWLLSYDCAFPGNRSIMAGPDGLTFVDSMRVDRAVVDSVKYPADSGWIYNFGGVAQIWYSGRVIHWLRDGTVDTTAVLSTVNTIYRQRPDTLFLHWTPDAIANPAVRVGTGPLLRYEGGTFCHSTWVTRRGPIILEEIDPSP